MTRLKTGVRGIRGGPFGVFAVAVSKEKSGGMHHARFGRTGQQENYCLEAREMLTLCRSVWPRCRGLSKRSGGKEDLTVPVGRVIAEAIA